MAEFFASKQQQNNQRIVLAPLIPLDTPLSMQIELASACNFKCGFCMHHDDNIIRSGKMRIGCMSMETFHNTVEGLKRFPHKLKYITLQSRGESLLNKHIIDMLHELKMADVVEKIGLYTNGTLLTPEMSDGLIREGLDVLHISINGVTEEQYEKVTKTKVKVEELIKNVTYFYQNKKGTYLYTKMICYDMDEKDKDLFIRKFDGISDDIFIEEPVDAWKGAGIDISGLKKNRYKENVVSVQICPRIFFACVVHFDGNVVACDHDWSEQEVIGNVNKHSISEIWKDEQFLRLRNMHLHGKADTIERCKGCVSRTECLPKDNLDSLLIGEVKDETK